MSIVATDKNDAAEAGIKEADESRSRVRASHKLLILAIVLLLAAGVWIHYATSSHQHALYKPGYGVGYYMGLAGGVMMLIMLLYPVRKYAKFARSWGPTRYWFKMHMMFGILGPTLVMFHSTFHIKSLNAAVATFSMLLVAGSGIIGRFIYTRIHHGLYGRKSELEELQQAVIDNQRKVNQISAVLMEAAGVGEVLKQFREMVLDRSGSMLGRAWRFMVMGWRRRKLIVHCHRELRRAVSLLAQSQHWDQHQQLEHFENAVRNVDDYLDAVQQANQFTTYERLFRLWHVLHTPFVYSLGLSGIVHVVATNFMY